DDDVPAALHEDVAPAAQGDAVARQHDAPAVLQVDVDLLVADVVAGHGEQADLVDVFGPGEAQVGPAGAELRLDGGARHRAFADAPLPHVDPQVGRLLRLRVVVVLDVVARDLEVAHLAVEDLDAAALAVADVAALDDGLVQVDAVEEDADPAAVVDVAGVDE